MSYLCIEILVCQIPCKQKNISVIITVSTHCYYSVYIAAAQTDNLPDEILAVAAESRLLEETRYELMILDFVHILLPEGAPTLHPRPSTMRAMIPGFYTSFSLVSHVAYYCH